MHLHTIFGTNDCQRKIPFITVSHRSLEKARNGQKVEKLQSQKFHETGKVLDHFSALCNGLVTFLERRSARQQKQKLIDIPLFILPSLFCFLLSLILLFFCCILDLLLILFRAIGCGHTDFSQYSFNDSDG